MPRKLLIALIAFLLTDLLYSAWQHYHGPLDGDMAAIVLPAERYRQILEDPFGGSVLLRDEHYGGVNRYFAHAAMALWFRTVPFAFQLFVSPLTSIFLACGLIKILTQGLLIWLLAVFASGGLRIRSGPFLLSAALVTPFFQTTGFGGAMSLIDASPTYTFFYALGFAILLLFLLPLFLAWKNARRVSVRTLVLLGLGAIIVVFNGPLNVPVLLLLILFAWARQFLAAAATKGLVPGLRLALLPRGIMILSVWCFLLCTYSMYIGRNNAENFWNDTVSLHDRYRLMPQGLLEFFVKIKGCLLLVLAVCGNALLLLRRREERQARALLQLLGWLMLFSAVYLALLPLGGYRPYRPYIVKKDLALPVLLVLLFFWALSGSYLLRAFRSTWRAAYGAGVALVILAMTVVDKPGRGRDYCEKQAITRLSSSRDSLVVLPADCNVLTWEPVTRPEDSKTSTEMLRYWKVLHADKRFIQR